MCTGRRLLGEPSRTRGLMNTDPEVLLGGDAALSLVPGFGGPSQGTPGTLKKLQGSGSWRIGKVLGKMLVLLFSKPKLFICTMDVLILTLWQLQDVLSEPWIESEEDWTPYQLCPNLLCDLKQVA